MKSPGPRIRSAPRLMSLRAAAAVVLMAGSATAAPASGPGAPPAAPSDPGPVEFQVRLETALELDDPKSFWYHPRVTPLPHPGGVGALMTIQRHLGVSDYYSGLCVMRRDSLDGGWRGPDAIAELDWVALDGGGKLSVADVTPGWHDRTERVLTIGCHVPYDSAGRQIDDRPRVHQTVYAVHDPKRGSWSRWQRLEMPDDRRFDFSRSACSQWLTRGDGNLLVPVYFGSRPNSPFSVTVVECAFDGQTLRYLRHGDELTVPVQRGLYEPSIIAFGGRYYLTMRNDQRGYVSVSDDGLSWKPIQPWTFDDGADLGSYNTQQHWLAHSQGLFLVYTRRGAGNDHILRHRAPLFMSRVDPDKLHVIRESERIIVPERGTELGNFGAAAIDSAESWVTVSEGIWGDAARRRGATGATFVARIIWSKPNDLARRVVARAAPPPAPVVADTLAPPHRLAGFSADVTVPLGHGMMGGSWLSKSISDPLEAHGCVILGAGAPIVLVSVDWCEIRNDAYVRWQLVLAEAADTRPERVLVTTVHQHEAPVADLDAERLLRDRKLAGSVCDPHFHERAVQAVAAALRASLPAAQPLTHIGTGQARVDKVASNRRYTLPDGSVAFNRMSRSQDPTAIAADEGLIDPWLKTLSFWNGETPLAAVSFYAVHPMSYYGTGEVSADFPGLARRRRQAETPGVRQIYCCGCAGNITAGKYNTGARENRDVLAGRLHAAMVEAWEKTQRHAIDRVGFRATPLHFEPRSGPGFTVGDLEKKLTPAVEPFQQCLAALGLSWRRRLETDRPIDVPVVDFGAAQIMLLPGESYVEFQLAAQQVRPDSFVCVAGYGEGATGYVPTDRHIAEGDSNLHDWWWVARGSEERLLEAIRRVLPLRQPPRTIDPALDEGPPN